MTRKNKLVLGTFVGLLLLALAPFLKKQRTTRQTEHQPPIDV
jgi:hypothetical protein